MSAVVIVEWSQGQTAETAVEVWNTQALLTAVLDAILSETDDVALAMRKLGMLRVGDDPAPVG
jgi:hypothetical protein